MPALETKVARSARPVPSRALIEGPSAWIGADMRGREAEWAYCLSPPAGKPPRALLMTSAAMNGRSAAASSSSRCSRASVTRWMEWGGEI
jgi:hypothetical protein